MPPLLALHAAGFEIPLVITRPDKRRGRGSQLAPSPVKAAAAGLGLAVGHDPADAAGVGADLGVVVAYGRIIATEVLAVVPMVNIHFSLLPRWRGAAPVERAILAGDTETGVCLMAVAPELDAGDVYDCRRVPIGPDDTLDTLRHRLVDEGVDLLVTSLRQGLGPPRPQVGEPVHADKLHPDEHRLDFSAPAEALHRTIRLGRAWCLFRDRRLKILEAGLEPAPAVVDGRARRPGALDGVRVSTGDGVLRLERVQPEGRQPMTAPAWRNGVQPGPDDHLA